LLIELVHFVKYHCHCDSELVVLACYGVEFIVPSLYCLYFCLLLFGLLGGVLCVLHWEEF